MSWIMTIGMTTYDVKVIHVLHPRDDVYVTIFVGFEQGAEHAEPVVVREVYDAGEARYVRACWHTDASVQIFQQPEN